MKKILISISSFVTVLPAVGFAQILPEGTQNQSAIFGNSFPEFVSKMVGFFNYLFGLLVVLSILAIFIGLFQSMTAPGNPEQQRKAKDVMQWGLIGVFVLLAIGGILNLLVNTIKFV